MVSVAINSLCVTSRITFLCQAVYTIWRRPCSLFQMLDFEGNKNMEINQWIEKQCLFLTKGTSVQFGLVPTVGMPMVRESTFLPVFKFICLSVYRAWNVTASVEASVQTHWIIFNQLLNGKWLTYNANVIMSIHSMDVQWNDTWVSLKGCNAWEWIIIMVICGNHN